MRAACDIDRATLHLNWRRPIGRGAIADILKRQPVLAARDAQHEMAPVDGPFGGDVRNRDRRIKDDFVLILGPAII